MNRTKLRRIFLLYFFMFLLVIPLSAEEGTPEPPVPTVTPIPTLEPTYTEFPTITPLPTETLTELPTATLWPTETATLTQIATLTEIASATATSTSTQAELTAELTETFVLETATEPFFSTATATSSATQASGYSSTLPPYVLLLADNFREISTDLWGEQSTWQLTDRYGEPWLQVNSSSTSAPLQNHNSYNTQISITFSLDAGIVWLSARNNNNQNYRVSVDTRGTITLYRSDLIVSQFAFSNWQAGNHTLSLTAHENLLVVVFDDVEVIAYTDASPLASGGLAFGSNFASNLYIKEIDVSIAQSEWEQLLAIADANLATSLSSHESSSSSFNLQSAGASPYANTILYIKTVIDGGNADSFIYSSNGVNFTDIDTGSLSMLSVSWSPDRTKIAFVRGVSDIGAAVYVMDAQPTTSMASFRRLTSQPVENNNYNISWSPTGSHIAFVSGKDIYTVQVCTAYPNCPTSNLTRTSSIKDYNPTWSPGGTQIAYVSHITGNPEIWTMNSNGLNKQQRTFTSNYEWYPDWSPINNELVISVQIPPNYETAELYLLNLGTGALSPVTSNGFLNHAPSWSPDGTQIVFRQVVFEQPLTTKVLITNRTGGGTTEVATLSENPDWGYPPLPPASTPTPTFVSGLHATYYSDYTDLTSVIPRANEYDPLINFPAQAWDLGSNVYHFASQWTGYITPKESDLATGIPGSFTLDFTGVVEGQDAIRVWWEGELVISTWGSTQVNASTRSALIPNVLAGQSYELWIEYIHYSDNTIPNLVMTYDFGSADGLVVPSEMLSVVEPNSMGKQPTGNRFEKSLEDCLERGDCDSSNLPPYDNSTICLAYSGISVGLREAPTTQGTTRIGLPDETNLRVFKIVVGEEYETGNSAWYYVQAARRGEAGDNILDTEDDVFGYIYSGNGTYVNIFQNPDGSSCVVLQEYSDANGFSYQLNPPQDDSYLDNNCALPFTDLEPIVVRQTPDINSAEIITTPSLDDDEAGVIFFGARTLVDGIEWYFVRYFLIYLDDETVPEAERWRFYVHYNGWVSSENTPLDYGGLQKSCENLPNFTPDANGNLTLDNISIGMSVNVSTPQAIGNEVIFTIRVTNNESFPLSNVLVQNQLPIGLEPTGNIPANYNAATGVWILDTLNPTSFVDLQLTAEVVVPENISTVQDSIYLNQAQLEIANSLVIVASDTQVEVQVIPRICYITGTRNPLEFRAPIRGNPAGRGGQSPANSTSNTNILIDAFAQDPIINGLIWVHVVYANDPEYPYTYIAPNNSENQPLLFNWVQINTTYQPRNLGYSSGFEISSEEMEVFTNCVNTGVLDDWTAFFSISPSYVTPDPAPISFTHLPFTVENICSASSSFTFFHGLGVSNFSQEQAEDIYAAGDGHHFGVDIFGNDGDTLYAISSGLVVGIGDGGPQSTINKISTYSWGSAILTEPDNTSGFSVIIRVGHLYVLYGHIETLSNEIYVGKYVNGGDVLGQIGQFNDSHAHIEVQALTQAENVILRDDINTQTGGNYNPYGILDYGPQFVGYVYDFTQFYNGAAIDPVTSVSYDIFGKEFINPDSIGDVSIPDEQESILEEGDNQLTSYRSPLFTIGSCSRRHAVGEEIYSDTVGQSTSQSNGYWGLRLQQGIVNNLPNPETYGTTP